MHPSGRFTSAKTEDEWHDVCFWTLIAYCNHGGTCASTFAGASQLQEMPAAEVEALLTKFVMSSPEERRHLRMVACPPHVRKNWLLGCGRRDRLAAARAPLAQVARSLQQKVKFVFVEETDSWRRWRTADVSEDDLRDAKLAWREAEEHEKARTAEDSGGVSHTAGCSDRLCHPSDDAAVRCKMEIFMRTRLKWTHRELHDTLLVAGLSAPSLPSLVSYFSVLYAQFGDAQTGFMRKPF